MSTTEEPDGARRFTRRQVLAGLGIGGASLAVVRPAAAFARSGQAAALVQAAAQTPAAGSDLGAVEHIIFLMMENRSYDHYFGAYPRGRGFDDHPAHSLGAFAQEFPGGKDLHPKGVLLPFHLDSSAGMECTDDLTHAWGPQHLCWNGGRMDSYVKVHTSSTYEGPHGAMTMGYYERSDLEFYWALADHFTLCDAYHCSILGPTHPNRLMANSGTIDPSGTHGGPVTDTNETPDVIWNCTWTTIQEVLEDAGVPWKVYSPTNIGVPLKYASVIEYPTWNPALYNPLINPEVMAVTDHVLPYFTAFRNPLSALYQKAFTPTFPNDFVSDVRAGTLPAVSWIIPPTGFDDHPSGAPDNGMWFSSLVLDALVANPEVWSKSALFLMYDENDGWFDHVPPPVPPPGTPGEHLTAVPSKLRDPTQDTLGITQPLGLGVRVPMLAISPFSRGGQIASDVFDHTSQLKLVAERFGVEIPNVSQWRRDTVGDLTSALFAGTYSASVPSLPRTAPDMPLTGTCGELTQDTASLGGAAPSVPTYQTMPNQSGGTVEAGAFFPAAVDKRGGEGSRTALGPPSNPRPSTVKSSANRLATDSAAVDRLVSAAPGPLAFTGSSEYDLAVDATGLIALGAAAVALAHAGSQRHPDPGEAPPP